MRRATAAGIPLLAAFILAACGSADSGPDNASSFTGSWGGSGGFVMTSAAPQVLEGTVLPPAIATLGADITTSGLNTIELNGLCPGGDPVPASVTGAASFRVGEFSCTSIAPDAASSDAGCSSPTTMHVGGGSGTLTSGSLAIAMTGSFTFCGGTWAFVYTFSGTRQ